MMREKLKKARKNAGLTQQQLAKELGISEIGYRKIEAGDRLGSFEVWDRLEDIFKIHQRILREISYNLPDTRGHPEKH